MTLIEELIKRLENEDIPTYSMTESQLKRTNEILKELIEEKNRVALRPYSEVYKNKILYDY